MPGAARTVYEFLHRRARFKRPKITVRDRVAAAKCGIVRRTFQKGLQQLQAMGLIERIGRGVNRVIHFFDRFAKPKKAPPKSKPPEASDQPNVAAPEAKDRPNEGPPILPEESDRAMSEIKRTSRRPLAR